MPQGSSYIRLWRRAQNYFSKDEPGSRFIPICLVSRSSLSDWKQNLPKQTKQWISSNFPIKLSTPSSFVLPNFEDGSSSIVVIFDEKNASSGSFEGVWKHLLPHSTYRLVPYGGSEIPRDLANKMCVSWGLYRYNFPFFKSSTTDVQSILMWPKQADSDEVLALLRANYLMRDLVNTPALSMGPEQLHGAASDLSEELRTTFKAIVGTNALIEANYPQVAAVGMAASVGREPRLIEMKWQPQGSEHQTLPTVTLIGKGVTFDTGGLNIKSTAGMKHMKKDMAGAAQALSLFALLVESRVPVALRLLLPVAENSIGGQAMRPGDVIRSRNGRTTEITNTDAEGRLILADALCSAVECLPAAIPPEGRALDPSRTDASTIKAALTSALPRSQQHHLIVDFATLTGAARVALGEDLPALFSNNEAEATKLQKLSFAADDPLWLMPLWTPYKSALRSDIADTVNSAEGGLAGAITAALYLSEFIVPSAPKSSESGGAESSANPSEQGSSNICWFHIDFNGFKKGAAKSQGLQSVFEYIRKCHAVRHIAVSESGPPGS
jgi:leucyl aminopeptidase